MTGPLSALLAARDDDTAIGSTPSVVIARFGRATLRRYGDGRTPGMLIVHGHAGDPALTDLDPERSLVAALRRAGADMWLLDWGRPGRMDRFETLDAQIGGPLFDAVARIRAETGARPMLLGVCAGGVMAACFAALFPERVAALALLVTPIDFHAEPLSPFARSARHFTPEEIAHVLHGLGGVSGRALGHAFDSLRPAETWRKYGADLAAADDPAAFLRLERWLAERPGFPEAAARQWASDLYRDNRLIAGRFRLLGRAVRLEAITAPTLAIAAARDHIVPAASALAIARALPGAATHCLDAGHVGALIGRGNHLRAVTLLMNHWRAAAQRLNIAGACDRSMKETPHDPRPA